MLYGIFACRYGDAVLQGVEQMGRALAGQDIPAGGGGAGDSNEGWGMFAFFGALVASVFGYSWWSSRKETKRYKVTSASEQSTLL